MPLELRPLAKEDAQEAAALLVASFENNPFRAIIYPTGMSLVSIDWIVSHRQMVVDDPNHYALKVVDTDNNDTMAGCAIWEYTLAMTDEDWEREKNEAPKGYPEVRHDVADQFIAKEQDSKCRIMGHTRWLGEYVPDSLMSAQSLYLLTADNVFNRTPRSQHFAKISASRRWIYAYGVGQ